MTTMERARATRSRTAVSAAAVPVWNVRSNEPMFVVDREERIVLWNDAATELLGFAADDALGRPCYEIVRGLTAEHRRYCGPECAVIRCAERGTPPTAFEILCPTGHGRLLWLEVRIVLTDSETGPLYVHVLRDIDEERRLIEYAREVMDSSAVALIRREVRPAAVVTSPLSTRETEVLRLLDRGERPAEIAERLNISRRTARNHVQSIISKLGAHSAIEALAVARRERLV